MDTYFGISNIERVSRICFYIGLGIIFVMVIAEGILYVLGLGLTDIIPPCVFYTVTGYYCAGCGGTRSILALLHGKLVSSFLYHPCVIYFGVYYVIYESSHMLNIVTHGRIRALRFCPVVFYVGAALIVVQWLVKDILVYSIGYSLDMWNSFPF